MKKPYLFLLAMLSIFAFSQAQNNFDFGFRVNQAVIKKLTSDIDKPVFFATDYTGFVKFGAVGFMAGITVLNNYNTVVIPTSQHLNCFNVGLFFTLRELNKNSSLCLYLYGAHFYTSLGYINVPAYRSNGVNYPTTSYNQVINFVALNPCYRYSFLKKMFSLEAGISIGVAHDNFSGYDSYVRPTIGANISLSINIIALINRN
jgi:hypothetical protein